MVFYSDDIYKRLKKKAIPKQLFLQFDNAFKALDITNDLSLFDVKKLKESKDRGRTYFRVRKGKYRAIFYRKAENYYIIALDKREEVYKKWQ